MHGKISAEKLPYTHICFPKSRRPRMNSAVNERMMDVGRVGWGWRVEISVTPIMTRFILMAKSLGDTVLSNCTMMQSEEWEREV